MSKTIPTNQNDITERVEKTSLVDADQFLISDSADSSILKRVQKSNVIPVASETVAGIVERATDAEASAGTDTERFITPAQLSSYGGGTGMVSNLGSISRLTTDSTGTQNVAHGLGVDPKTIIFKGVIQADGDGWSDGFTDDDLNDKCMYKEPSQNTAIDDTYSIRVIDSGGNGWYGQVSAVDTTNFTISWSKQNTGENIQVIWIAQA